MLRLMMLGAPGSGKGTQAPPLVERYGIPHVSTGDIFRNAVKEQSALGAQVRERLKKGELVPDDLTVATVRERLERADCAAGFILDGFPRSVAQAKTFDAILAESDGQLDKVLFIAVSTPVLTERLSARRQCRDCDAGYNLLFKPTQQDGVCDACGGEIYQRPDDQPAAVKTRLEVYAQETQPLIDYYEQAGLLSRINGEGDIADITSAILDALDSREQ